MSDRLCLGKYAVPLSRARSRPAVFRRAFSPAAQAGSDAPLGTLRMVTTGNGRTILLVVTIRSLMCALVMVLEFGGPRNKARRAWSAGLREGGSCGRGGASSPGCS